MTLCNQSRTAANRTVSTAQSRVAAERAANDGRCSSMIQDSPAMPTAGAVAGEDAIVDGLCRASAVENAPGFARSAIPRSRAEARLHAPAPWVAESGRRTHTPCATPPVVVIHHTPAAATLRTPGFYHAPRPATPGSFHSCPEAIIHNCRHFGDTLSRLLVLNCQAAMELRLQSTADRCAIGQFSVWGTFRSRFG